MLVMDYYTILFPQLNRTLYVLDVELLTHFFSFSSVYVVVVVVVVVVVAAVSLSMQCLFLPEQILMHIYHSFSIIKEWLIPRTLTPPSE